MRADGKVFVEIVGPHGADLVNNVDLKGLHQLNVEIGRADESEKTLVDGTRLRLEPLSVAGNRAEAWVPAARIVDAALRLPDGYRIEEVLPLDYDEVMGEGPAAINSDSYRDAGHDGSGLTVGVIDRKYHNLDDAQTNGDAPASYTQVNYTPYPFINPDSSETHGTGCVEAMYDHVPGANWVIYKIDSISDLNSIVTHAINNDVDVLSHSLPWYNTGLER